MPNEDFTKQLSNILSTILPSIVQNAVQDAVQDAMTEAMSKNNTNMDKVKKDMNKVKSDLDGTIQVLHNVLIEWKNQSDEMKKESEQKGSQEERLRQLIATYKKERNSAERIASVVQRKTIKEAEWASKLQVQDRAIEIAAADSIRIANANRKHQEILDRQKIDIQVGYEADMLALANEMLELNLNDQAEEIKEMLEENPIKAPRSKGASQEIGPDDLSEEELKSFERYEEYVEGDALHPENDDLPDIKNMSDDLPDIQNMSDDLPDIKDMK